MPAPSVVYSQAMPDIDTSRPQIPGELDHLKQVIKNLNAKLKKLKHGSSVWGEIVQDDVRKQK
eukprot:3659062-Rhodomonas_salina.1